MESLKVRYNAAKKCLSSLEKIIRIFEQDPYPEVHVEFRDSLIKRFELSLDTFWKFLPQFLEVKHGVRVAVVSPREVLKTALQLKEITKEELDLFNEMITDRNLACHTYNEIFAEEMSERIKVYYQLLHNFFERLHID